jgi:type I restriction enzyme S subunit
MALGLTPQQIIDKNTYPLLRISERWERIELKYLAKIQNGFAFSSNYFNHTDGVPLIRIRDINKPETENLYSGEYSEEFIVNNKDILIGMDGDFNVSKWPGKKGLLNQRVCRLIFNAVYYDKEFLFICLQPYLNAINEETSAVTVKHLSSRSINDIPVPLAPLPEQRAIVAKIEQLFSELDHGVANLRAAKAKLDIYRQAVLKKAFEAPNPSLRINLIEAESKIQIGPFGSQLHKEDYIENGIPLINPMHIQNGKICPSPAFSITEEKSESLPNYTLQNGDIIMGRRGEMGRCALVTFKEQGWFCGTGSLFVRPNPNKIYSPYLYYYLSSPIVIEILTGKATGTTMLNLNRKIISDIPIYLPNIQEQTQIVQEIESRLSVCDNILANIAEALEKAEALRQSILKKAFEGRLLSAAELAACRAEADWEPAGVLLARIRKAGAGK